MLGHLIKQDSEWMVKYDNNGDIKLYPLCPETKKWSENPNTKKYIKENIEVVFDFESRLRVSCRQTVLGFDFQTR